jgi:hypothetical protein
MGKTDKWNFWFVIFVRNLRWFTPMATTNVPLVHTNGYNRVEPTALQFQTNESRIYLRWLTPTATTNVPLVHTNGYNRVEPTDLQFQTNESRIYLRWLTPTATIGSNLRISNSKRTRAVGSTLL